jgi:hypothetical protein
MVVNIIESILNYINRSKTEYSKSYVVFIDFPNKLVGTTWLGETFMDGEGVYNDFINDDLLPVGHSSVLFINGNNKQTIYSEFGRYDSRENQKDENGNLIIRKKDDKTFNGVTGITRSTNTNPELLTINIKPEVDSNGEILNIKDILQNLRDLECFFNKDEKTFKSPYDMMICSVLKVKKGKENNILNYIKKMENKGSIQYGAPLKMYCSRYARNVIRKAGYFIPWHLAKGITTIHYLNRKFNNGVVEIEPNYEGETITSRIFEIHYEKLLQSRKIKGLKKFLYKNR